MMLDEALRYVALGWSIFPCHTAIPGGGCSCEHGRRRRDPGYKCSSPGKHPRTGHGLDDASNDPVQIREWWEQWPDANIALNCGKSGLLVVDRDAYKDFYRGDSLDLDDNTVSAISGGGGGHLVYAQEPGDTYGNSNKNLPDGIDIRGHGGYIIVAPSNHKSGGKYQWEADLSPWDIDPAPIPPKLRDLLDAGKAQREVPLSFDTSVKYNGAGASQYGQRALEIECERIATAMDGTRNNTLNTAAFSIGQLVAGGEISEDLAWERIINAATLAGLSLAEAERTAGSGMDAGKAEPRSSTPLEDGGADVDETMALVDCPDPALLFDRPPFDLLDYNPEDGGILDLWFDLYGADRMFTVGFDVWYYWAGTHWRKDEALAVNSEIERLIEHMNNEARRQLSRAIEKEDKKFWGRYVNATNRSKTRVSSVETMARARCAVATNTLDTSNTLNLSNGVLCLETLELRPHEQKERLTYCLPYPYDIDADCPRFRRFVGEVMVKDGTIETDRELCKVFQESLGYALTNDTQHEAMFWFSGDGGNGKTVAITILQMLLGPLCGNVSFEEMGRAGNYDLAEVAGKRVVFSTESERGGKLSEGHIKRIASGERISARPIYGSPFEFKSTAKIFWAMNDLPVIKDTSNGVWRRLQLIPFHRTFTDKDKDTTLLTQLSTELSGILNYALQGLNNLRIRGRLPESKAIIDAVSEYRHENNPIQQWMDECTQPSYTPNTLPDVYPCTARQLFDNYRQWSDANGRQTYNSTNFGRELRRLKIPKSKDVRGITYALSITGES